jgi:Holliday junction resolvase
MAEKPETRFRRRLVKELQKLPRVMLFSIQQAGIRGTPDILACVNGVFVAIEVKASLISKPSALQSYNIQKIKEACGVGMVIFPENFASQLELIKEIAYGKTDIQ